MTDKYIVFKVEDLMEDQIRGHDFKFYDPEDAIDDAVVIRRQDLFAAGALHTYSHTISMSAYLVTKTDPEQGKKLQNIADYFHEQAVLAEEEGFKVPD